MLNTIYDLILNGFGVIGSSAEIWSRHQLGFRSKSFGCEPVGYGDCSGALVEYKIADQERTWKILPEEKH